MRKKNLISAVLLAWLHWVWGLAERRENRAGAQQASESHAGS